MSFPPTHRVRSHQRTGLRSKPFLLTAAVGAFLSLAFAQELFDPASGLQQAEAIGPYLNGKFSAQAPTPGADSATYTIANAFPNLTFRDPVKLLELPSGQFMVFGKSGHAWIFANDPAVTTKTLVLDVSNQTRVDGDGGLLGAALHPEFGQAGSANARYFYVWYRYYPPGNMQGEQAFMRLSRFTLNTAYTGVEAGSEYVLIQQFDRQSWHNGGDMFFGPEGFLYLAVGDEGGANDQYNRTQSINSWFFGGVFRIDVDKRGGAISHPIRRQPINGANPPTGWPSSFTQGYYVPNDNPWQDPNGGILEEFWALGTRSPHRMTYDPPTGDIWIGDVGQGSREEISRVFMGANLQWPYREGDINGPKAKPSPLIGFDQTPVFSYNRTFGQCVIGGYVIRGNKYPELNGRYIFGDHETQQVWTFELGPFGTAQNLEFLLHVPTHGTGSKDGISSFARTNDGTLYILDLYGTNLDGGKIHKLVRVQHGVPPPPPLLSQLGVFTNMATMATAPGIIPYEINSALWSDRALKRRWIAVPNDGAFDTQAERIGLDPDDHWTFPAGTVMIKHFELPLNESGNGSVARLETRFFIMGNSGQAYGLTYRWNDAGTDAFLIDQEEIRDLQVTRANGSTYTQTWTFPSRQQCMTCHTSAAGFALGLKVHQLNRTALYPSTGVTADQLFTWEHLGLFDTALPAAAQRRKSHALDDLTASLEERVLSYMDANCAHCHRPNGVQGAFDARYATPLAQKGLVNEPTIGMNSPVGQLVVEPGDTLGSELWVRDSRPNGQVGSMPPLGKALVDKDYMAVLTEWIMGLDPQAHTTDRTALYLKVFLEGPYAAGTMADGIRAAGHVPQVDPYTALGLHVGSAGQGVASAHTLQATGARRVVDWVLVELRNPTTPAQIMHTYGALVLSDGTVIAPQGGPLRVPIITGSHHVAVRHRNHLGVMTAAPLAFTGAPVVLDLTAAATPVHGTAPRKDMGGGVMALWAGDVNGDGAIRYLGAGNDRDPLLGAIGGAMPTLTSSGYRKEDVDLDGVVRYIGVGNDRDRILQNVGGTTPTATRAQQLP